MLEIFFYCLPFEKLLAVKFSKDTLIKGCCYSCFELFVFRTYDSFEQSTEGSKKWLRDVFCVRTFVFALSARRALLSILNFADCSVFIIGVKHWL